MSTPFRHPAIDAMDLEKSALRAVLKALASLDDETARRVLERAAQCYETPHERMTREVT